MKTNSLSLVPLALGLGMAGAGAQDSSPAAQMAEIKRQLQQTQEKFERTLREQQAVIDSLRKQVEAMQQAQGASPRAGAPGSAGSLASDPLGQASAQLGARPWAPSDPIRIQSGRSYLDLGLVANVVAGGSTARDVEGGLQTGGHDPNQRGFTLQAVEASFSGAVDPYLKGYANLLFLLDSGGESVVELEEAYAETIALPGNLQLRAGQYLTEFGRLNTAHPHTWDFVDSPLVNARFLGPDGLRNLGLRLSWLVPTPFYSELFLNVQNSQGETAFGFRNEHGGAPYLGRLHAPGPVGTFSDLLLAPRYALSLNLTDSQTLLAGVSAAFGPNGSGSHARTEIYGVDLFWKWKPADHSGGFPFVTWQTEAMLRRYQAGAFDWDLNADTLLDPDETDLDANGVPDVLPRERLRDYGAYSQVAWGFRQGWVAALRGDYVNRTRAQYENQFGADPVRAERWRISPNLTWYPSEFSKVRLQFNQDWRENIGCDQSVWLQLEFSLGAHAAHKF